MKRLFSPGPAGVLLAFLAILFSGCPRSEPQADVPPPSPSRQVPLRVAYVGTESEAEAIQRAWLAVSDQPLEITATSSQAEASPDAAPVEANAQDSQANRLIAIARQQDVLIYPAAHTGELQQADAVRRLRNNFFDVEATADQAGAEILPALRGGVMRYGEDWIGVPLGAVQPVLIRPPGEAEASARFNWQAYGERAAALGKGKSAEPLADGWAALALLNRANSYCGPTWLFSGDELRPTLATAPYLRALRELQQDAQHYPEQRMTPDEVWQAANAGQLELAISWPASYENLSSDADLVLQAIPTSDERFNSHDASWQAKPADRQGEWVFLMNNAPLASIAAGCRQTAASEGFLRWLGGNEGTAGLRDAIPSFTVTRDGAANAAAGGTRLTSQYTRLLSARLAIDYVRPVLRIPAADQYMQALDQQVIAVLQGEKTPESALIDASEAWEKITDAHDRRSQARHWRWAQGMAH